MEYLDNWKIEIKSQSERARSLVEGLSEDLLNQKPASDKWSIGELVEHLMITNELYFGIIRPVIDDASAAQDNLWWKVFQKMMGKMILKSINPVTTKKYKTMKVFEPRRSAFTSKIAEDFIDQQNRLLALVDDLQNVEINKTYIASPVGSWVIYSIEDALTIILNHEKRHLAQAESLKAALAPG